MKAKRTGIIIAAAVASIIATVSFGESNTTTTTTTTTNPNPSTNNFQNGASAMVHCVGINSCKGKSSCRTQYNACKGLNSCQGQGWIATTAFDCQKQGGTEAQ